MRTEDYHGDENELTPEKDYDWYDEEGEE